MYLRNKKTGKIIEKFPEDFVINTGSQIYNYFSLAELNEEWEDYEEPKEYWAIDCFSPGSELVSQFSRCSERIIENRKQIGNYFETKEEAEKAVEKLKTVKRLKEAGAEFYGWRRNQTGTYELYMRWYDRIPRSYEVKKDLDLLFGGKQ